MSKGIKLKGKTDEEKVVNLIKGRELKSFLDYMIDDIIQRNKEKENAQ